MVQCRLFVEDAVDAVLITNSNFSGSVNLGSGIGQVLMNYVAIESYQVLKS